MGDSIVTAELVTVPSVVNGTTVGANPSTGAYAGTPFAQPSAWYKLVVTETTYVRVKISGEAGYRPYAETYYSLTGEDPLSGDDIDFYWDSWWEAGPGGAERSQRCPFSPGTYWIAVMDWNFSGAVGAFELEFSFAPVGPDDLDYTDETTVNDPSENIDPPFFMDPGNFAYLRIARASPFNATADFAVRKQRDPPPNDAVVDARVETNPSAICTPGTIQTGFNYWNNENAESEDGEPAHAGFPARKSVWFSWDPAQGVPYDIWLESEDDDYVLAVYQLAALGDLGPALASDDDSGDGNQPFLTVTNPTAGPLLIAVDSKGNGGQFSLWARLSSATRPPNDDLSDRITLGTLAGTVTADLAGASFECGTPKAQQAVFPSGFVDVEPIGGDVWYQFTPTGNDYTLTWSSDEPVRISVYTAPTGTPTVSQLVPYSIPLGLTPSASGTVTFAVTPGTVYYVRVEQADDAQTTVDFEWATPAPETGDDIEDAPDVVVPPTGGVGSSYDYDLGGSGQQPNEPLDTPGQTIRTVWRKFVPEHDCTYWTQYRTQANVYMTQPSGHNIDFWRDPDGGPTPTLGTLDLVACQMSFFNRGDGFRQWFGVRLKKDETYWIRHSNPSTSAPGTAQRMYVEVEYEMDDVWTDADGWDSTDGASTYLDGVLQFSEQATRTVTPWVGDRSAFVAWISFDMRVLSEWSDTAADGPVLGRQPGPSIYYPFAGNRIGVLKLYYSTQQPGNTMVREISVVGTRDGHSYLEAWNGISGGNSVDTPIWSHFALPNDEDEGGEWIPIDITPIGIYVHGRLAVQGNYATNLLEVEWGAHRFPIDTFWGNTGPAPVDPPAGPPETWTLQLRDMRITDSARIGPRIFEREPGDTPVVYQNMLVDFDTRIGALDPANLVPYQKFPSFMSGDSGFDTPSSLQVPNPGTRSWGALRIHDQCRWWKIAHHDNHRRHSGFWIWFDEFPSDTNGTVVISAMIQWSGTSLGYLNDLCRLEVNSLGELHIYPFRNWRKADTATVGNQVFLYDAGNKKIKIGDVSLGAWYWIETMVDFTFPWDAKMRVAVNEVECHPYYSGVLNQAMGNVASARYQGVAFPWSSYAEQAIGTPTGNPNTPGNDQDYTGHCELHLGPWCIGRGGLESYASREGLPEDIDFEEVFAQPGIGAHAGAMVSFTRDGVHKVLDVDDVDYFETAAAAGTIGGQFYEYQGVRLYKGSKSEDHSFNYDLSLGTSGYSEYGWAAQPALPPVIVADGSGPSAPLPDHSGENALQWEHDPSGPGGDDNARFGSNWPYIYVGVPPPEGVREGGDPNDDGGNHFIVFAFIKRVGGTYAQIDMMKGVRGDIAAGPTWQAVEEWGWVFGDSYPNYDLSGGIDAFGHWEMIMQGGALIRMKDIHVFMNPHTYPRFKTTTDNGATTTWVEHPDDPVVSFINDDPTEPTNLGVFMDNVCPFERLDRTGPNVPGLLGSPPTGISMGDYRHRRYVEIRPPTEPDLEETNLRISALRVMARGAGYGGSGPWGDISTARTSGTLKVRMVHGTHTHVVHDFPFTNTDKCWVGQVIPMTPMMFAWQTDRVAETKIRMGYHFNYHDKSLNDSYGYRVHQAGAAVCKSIAYEVFCETTPGPPICGGATQWTSRLTKRI